MLAMIERIVEIKEAINAFILYYNLAIDREDFNRNQTELNTIEAAEWALLGGLTYLV